MSSASESEWVCWCGDVVAVNFACSNCGSSEKFGENVAGVVRVLEELHSRNLGGTA